MYKHIFIYIYIFIYLYIFDIGNISIYLPTYLPIYLSIYLFSGRTYTRNTSRSEKVASDKNEWAIKAYSSLNGE